ncbi:hypothetical protein QFC24_000630 [Naganishia onofrii]|uniref:Uncharacterized protein n=1 Tax=Naganishia onofrii TaxID=1851511 RepID=A0ACC2XXV5_9TREE|nr:hypothetical protein QFC24_000630 [Naganishia onofrii]
MTATAALQQAFDAFQQGADLFEQASKNIQDHGALAAVNLLIIQNRKQMKDITRRLNTLKIQQRQRQINLDKAASAVEKETQKRHQSRELGLNKRTTTTTVTTTTASIGDRKQPSPAATVLAVAAATAAAAESRTDRHTTRDPKDDTGGASSSPNTSMIDPDKRLNSRRRRVNPATATATTSMIGSSKSSRDRGFLPFQHAHVLT